MGFLKKKTDEIEPNVEIEVKTKEDVDFEMEQGWVGPITALKRKRAAKKLQKSVRG